MSCRTNMFINEIFLFVQLAAPPTLSVPSQRFVLTEIVLTPVSLTTHAPPTPSATPPTTSLPADVLLDWRAILTSTVSVWSAGSTRTVHRPLPVSTTSAPTRACTRTRVLPPPRAVSRTTTPSARVLQAGWAILWSPADPRKNLWFLIQIPNVSLTETVLMTLLASMSDVRTRVTPCHLAT